MVWLVINALFCNAHTVRRFGAEKADIHGTDGPRGFGCGRYANGSGGFLSTLDRGQP
jgi:hypothetical protein